MSKTTFKQLEIGQSFDFNDPSRPRHSFSHRCWKVSARRYRNDFNTFYRVGTVNCAVFHVGKVETVCEGTY